MTQASPGNPTNQRATTMSSMLGMVRQKPLQHWQQQRLCKYLLGTACSFLLQDSRGCLYILSLILGTRTFVNVRLNWHSIPSHCKHELHHRLCAKANQEYYSTPQNPAINRRLGLLSSIELSCSTFVLESLLGVS